MSLSLQKTQISREFSELNLDTQVD